jgi:two-component system, OmpR family, sensor histidine kinase SenX3
VVAWAAVVIAALAIVTVVVLGVRARQATLRLRNLTSAADPAARAVGGLAVQVERTERYVQQLRGQALEGDALVSELRSAFEGLSVGVLLAGPDGSVLIRNQAAGRYLGGRHEEALVRAAADRLTAAAGSGQPVSEDVHVTGPPRRVVQVVATPLPADELSGDRWPCVVTFVDITDQIRTDEVRRDFVANLSHELKGPIGAVGLLADALEGEPDAVTRAHLVSRMSAELSRLDHTIGDLLELSRLEFDGAARRGPVPLAALVDEAVDAVHHRAEQAGVKVHPESAGATAELDRVQVVRALCNLLDNAISYSDAGDEVRISAECRGERAVFSVTDQGVGIPGADLERIFERFYRVDTARSRATGGTGLGLAIVRHVAQNHGGEVEVTSREGEGSVFTLSLPGVAT